MIVWAVVDKHRVVSVWTTEEAAHRAADPDQGQIIVEAGVLRTLAAMSARQ